MSPDDTLISVVIPAYNHERFVGEAIDSVLNQTHENLELIVVDDGSTDNTAKVIKGYKDSRLSYYYQENQDAYNTINRGLGLAKGDWIAILNSDDIYEENRLARLLTVARERKLHCLFTDVIPISDDSEPFTDPEFGWNIWHRKNRDFYQQCGDLYTAFLKGNFMVTTSNLFYSRQALQKVGTFCSLRYLHDYDYIFRIMLDFPQGVHYLENEKLLYYRIHDGNTLSEAAITGREQDKEVIYKYMLAALPQQYHKYCAAGVARLVELEQELAAVRSTLAADTLPGIKKLSRQLARAVKKKIFKGSHL